MGQKLKRNFLMLTEGAGEETGGSSNGGEETGGSSNGGEETPQLNDHGFPDNTPIKEMTDSQKAAYWKYHSRKNENLLKSSVPKAEHDKVQSELDQMRREGLSDADKQLADAKALGFKEAQAKFGPRLVKESIKARVSGRLSDEALDEQLEFVDVSRFLTDEGDVDADKVERYASSLKTSEGENSGTGERGPAHKKAWTTGPGSDRSNPGESSHSVRSAQEEHIKRLQNR